MGDIFAQVVDGKLVDQTSGSSKTDSKKTSNDSLDKNAFLQLLVAEMQYQDPLEPTTNTEYVSQFATFSQLEATQNVELSNKVQLANSLVGEQVIMKVTSETTGQTTYESGQVDYTYLENDKVFLSIGGSLYNIDDLDTVADPDYLDAVNLAQMLTNMVKKLPAAEDVSLDNKANIKTAETAYNEMTAYQKQYVGADVVKKLAEAVGALEALEGKTEEISEE